MKHIYKFSELTKQDTRIAGGKGASLGEMLTANIPVPNGFVVAADTFDYFIKETDLIQEITTILGTVDHKIIHTVDGASEKIQNLIMCATMPQVIADEILQQYDDYNMEYVAVRSSATAEDGADHAWAGQLSSYLNTTKDTLLHQVKNCWASLFTPRAIFYRFEKGLDTTHISVAVVVQKMVNSEKSGIAFSVHPVTEDHNQIIIEAGFGLGEAIVSGSVTPDAYVVTKKPKDILDINVNFQNKALYRSEIIDEEHGYNEWKELPANVAEQQVLDKEQILELSNIIETIENHYGFPCDIEWAFENNTFYIVQSRPITTLKLKKPKQEFFDKQISLTEWLGNMSHDDATKHRDEDNEKRERLAVLNEIIGLPFDRPTQFSLLDVVNKSDEFELYLEQHGKDKCALRLIPLDSSLQKLRMRGKTVKEVVEGWLVEQKIDPSKYRADFVPDADVTYWSTIFVVNKNGVRGEIIADSHEKLTQGFYLKHTPISFEYDFDQWKLFPANQEAQKQLEKVLNYLKVDEVQKTEISKRLNGTFSDGYLNGYFETVDTDQGLWFIDYNRLITQQIPSVRTSESKGDLNGQSACLGKYDGVVSIVTDPDAVVFNKGDVLVCDMTSPIYLPLMARAGAIITNRGGVTCHAAIVARELNVPCIIGTKNATEILKCGDLVEVDADHGVVTIINKGS